MKTYLLPILAAFALLGASCRDPKSTRNFRLPEGDPAEGQAAFVALNCIKCHTVAGVELPSPAGPGGTMLALGGKVTRLRTYGSLLTSIAHPTDSLSRELPLRQSAKMPSSPMPEINDVMTVRQLIDLVAFLQPRYQNLNPLYELDYPALP